MFIVILLLSVFPKAQMIAVLLCLFIYMKSFYKACIEKAATLAGCIQALYFV